MRVDLHQGSANFGTLTVTNCCIESIETIVGSGNIGLDPVFTDADGPDDTVGTADDNLRPRGGPTVNNGNANALPPDVSDLDRDGDLSEATPLDLDGNPRIRGVVDMGPYEG